MKLSLKIEWIDIFWGFRASIFEENCLAQMAHGSGTQSMMVWGIQAIKPAMNFSNLTESNKHVKNWTERKHNDAN